MKLPARDMPAEILEEKIADLPAIDDDEPTTAELVDMLRQALHEAKTGQTRPASEVLRELREMLASDDDSSRHR